MEIMNEYLHACTWLFQAMKLWNGFDLWICGSE